VAKPGPKAPTEQEKKDEREKATRETLIHHAQTANGATARRAREELAKRTR